MRERAVFLPGGNDRFEWAFEIATGPLVVSWEARLLWDDDATPVAIGGGEVSGTNLVVVSPADLWRTVEATAGPIDWGLVGAVLVVLTHGADDAGAASRRELRVLTRDRPTAHWEFADRDRQRAAVRYETRFVLQDHQVVPGARGEFDGRLLVVDGPFVEQLDLTVVPGNHLEPIKAVTVEIDYHDPTHDYRAHRWLSLRQSAGDSPGPLTTTIPLMDAGHQRYRYRVIAECGARPTIVSDWVEEEGDRVIVAEVLPGVVQRNLVVIPELIDFERTPVVEVSLRNGLGGAGMVESQNESVVFVRGNGAGELRHFSAGAEVEYTVKWYGADGSILEQRGSTAGAYIVPAPRPTQPAPT
jgi:hypothetical protein